MNKVITDKNKINEVLTRGVENIYPDKKSLEEALSSEEKLKIYCGFDPSAPSLHIGNAIQINKLAQFQALGHEIIFLIGDFTGMIGDPTDKTAARKKLTRKEVLTNSKNYKKQAEAFLKFSGGNSAKVMHNSKWHDKMTFRDLIEVSSNFTVQQMLARDMFEKRYRGEIQCTFCDTRFTIPFFTLAQGTITSGFKHAENIKCPKCGKTESEMLKVSDTSKLSQMFTQPKPIYLHEFLYPLAQGYDSVAMDVDLEIGGNDQTFNMLAGRDLMKAVKGKEKFVLTTKLLVDETGKKMGKTEGNIVNLDVDNKNMYGQIMAWPDGVIANGFELCTNVAVDEVVKIREELKAGQINPRDLKMKLAREITKIFHGEKKAKEAEEFFVSTVQKKEVPEEIEIIKVNDGRINIIQLLIITKLALSNGEARRLIQQGGIKVDGKTITFIGEIIEIKKEGVLIQRGKRQFVRVVLS